MNAFLRVSNTIFYAFYSSLNLAARYEKTVILDILFVRSDSLIYLFFSFYISSTSQPAYKYYACLNKTRKKKKNCK